MLKLVRARVGVDDFLPRFLSNSARLRQANKMYKLVFLGGLTPTILRPTVYTLEKFMLVTKFTYTPEIPYRVNTPLLFLIFFAFQV